MIKFGPSGACELFLSTEEPKTENMAGFVKAHGLDCFEYSFGRGVRMSADKARSIDAAFQKAGVEISVHAPYFINLANPDEEMAQKSFGYILDSARMGRLMGAKRVVFHPAAQGKEPREVAFARTVERVKQLCELIYRERLQDMIFCPETMGKLAQIGTVEEIASLCKIDEVFVPCIDFGHVNARGQGCLKGEADYLSLLDEMINELGEARMKHFHVHFSKIQYGARGEIKHLTFEDEIFGPRFEPLANALVKRKEEPYIVCESAGTQTVDAMAMKEMYLRAQKSGEEGAAQA